MVEDWCIEVGVFLTSLTPQVMVQNDTVYSSSSKLSFLDEATGPMKDDLQVEDGWAQTEYHLLREPEGFLQRRLSAPFSLSGDREGCQHAHDLSADPFLWLIAFTFCS